MKRTPASKRPSVLISFMNYALNNNLNSHPQFIYDETGSITGYKTVGGADTVFPFSNAEIIEFTATGTYKNPTITFENRYKSDIGVLKPQGFTVPLRRNQSDTITSAT